MADESQTSGGATGNNTATGTAPASSSEYIKLRVVGQVQLIFGHCTIQKPIY